MTPSLCAWSPDARRRRQASVRLLFPTSLLLGSTGNETPAPGHGHGHANGVWARDEKHHDGVDDGMSIRFIPDRCGCPAPPQTKKPTRLNTLRYSTTSAYSTTSPPACTELPIHPVIRLGSCFARSPFTIVGRRADETRGLVDSASLLELYSIGSGPYRVTRLTEMTYDDVPQSCVPWQPPSRPECLSAHLRPRLRAITTVQCLRYARRERRGLPGVVVRPWPRQECSVRPQQGQNRKWVGTSRARRYT